MTSIQWITFVTEVLKRLDRHQVQFPWIFSCTDLQQHYWRKCVKYNCNSDKQTNHLAVHYARTLQFTVGTRQQQWSKTWKLCILDNTSKSNPVFARDNKGTSCRTPASRRLDVNAYGARSLYLCLRRWYGYRGYVACIRLKLNKKSNKNENQQITETYIQQ